MIKFVSLLLCLMAFFSIINVHARTQTTFLIPTGGTIDYSAKLVFSQDFENVYRRDNNRLGNFGWTHWMEFGSSGRYWIEEDFAHSGSKCLALEALNGRAKFAIFDMQEAGNEVTISLWYFMPTDYAFETSSRWNQILQIGNTNMPAGAGYRDLVIEQPSASVQSFTLGLYGRTPEGNRVNYVSPRSFNLRLGEWWNLRAYYRHDAVDGAVKIWIDGVLFCDVSNIETAHVNEWEMHFGPYGEQGEHFLMWTDDIDIYQGYVEP